MSPLLSGSLNFSRSSAFFGNFVKFVKYRGSVISARGLAVDWSSPLCGERNCIVYSLFCIFIIIISIISIISISISISFVVLLNRLYLYIYIYCP